MARLMKDSGIEWIGEIPETWKIVRIGSQYTERKTKVSDTEYPPLSVTMKGIMPQLATAAKTDAHDDRKLVCVGDFAINSRSDRRGSCGISAYNGSVSLINTILCPRDEMNPRYYDWLFHSTMFSDEFYKWGHGIVDDLWTTNWQDMKRISIPEPPIAEQQRIADFLDHKCVEIEAVIEKTKATIEEYKKLKQSVITEAVTKGIRGNRPMKDSGIDWIGEIPEEWRLVKMHHICTTITDYVASGSFASLAENVVYLDEPDYAMLVRTMDVSGKGYSGKPVYINQHAYEFLSNSNLFGGEIMLPNIGASVGDVYLVPKLYERMSLAPNAIMLRTNICDKYVYYYFMGNSGRRSVLDIAESTAQPKFNKTDFRQLRIPLPSNEEQEEIIAYLDEKCAALDTIIAKKTALLTELETYKKSLIYECVTGKKECPEVIAHMAAAKEYPYFPATVNARNSRFAQAVLMSKILDIHGKGIGRVKLEKMLYTIETSIGFDFETEYVREIAGPLHESVYKCEGIISRKNKWYQVHKSQYGVSYIPTKYVDEYRTYYDRYFSAYNAEIERIINIFKPYNTDQAEVVATLFAAWNDAIIEGKPFTDESIVDDVLNNWNNTKKRFPRDMWLRAMEQMRKNSLVPKGYCKRTVTKTTDA